MVTSQRIQQLKEKVALLPDSPGVYQFLGDDGKVIYVGKAKNLKRRVSSYFLARADHSPKVRVMVGKIADLRHPRSKTARWSLRRAKRCCWRTT